MAVNTFYMKERNKMQKFKDFITLPLRAVALFETGKWGLSSTQAERFEYAAKEVLGCCLDIGCGKYNLFINKYLNGNGKGVDIFPYEGLVEKDIMPNLETFPFPDQSFDSATFIASLNHIPEELRDKELAESYRCLKVNSNVIVTMPCAFAGILIHIIVAVYDSIFGTNYDVDSVRGMHQNEDYYLPDKEIIERLQRAGFKNISKKYFWTQWGMNHAFIGWKK
ncbi:hypothetical protein A3H05_01250 [Candidatus Giovannonibacteria bacterium RIFCSPLOWO2_12_FULL_43_26]|uniref:Uncharacterized protein n=3 Tax=Parcubacteria group TaxID=1794811 RepID=A0A1F5XYH8_9BACT|nr:MAG: hypothetical protein UU83_C0013G0016 [Candidatus Jorgensenbacteria bacterium GW2011_GWF2_41_8]OGF92922.1 MAG: hypothetical protein A3H05_01250 [Candidatus Giovannonibacteria bacterium RIFCSPLOWO2_12_FULL_43_26]